MFGEKQKWFSESNVTCPTYPRDPHLSGANVMGCPSWYYLWWNQYRRDCSQTLKHQKLLPFPVTGPTGSHCCYNTPCWGCMFFQSFHCICSLGSLVKSNASICKVDEQEDAHVRQITIHPGSRSKPKLLLSSFFYTKGHCSQGYKIYCRRRKSVQQLSNL